MYLLMFSSLVGIITFSSHETSLTLFFYVKAGRAKASGREPKTGLGRVFNYKLGCYDDVHVIMYTDAHPYL